jgi:hypothetical protein
MSTHGFIFVLVGVVLLGALGVADPLAAQDGSVRFLSAGPVRLGDGYTAHMRVFLPAVQRPVHVHFLGDAGTVLKTLEVEPPRRGGPFFEVFFQASFAEPVRGQGTLSITDGTSNTIFLGPSDGIIAILIGLRQVGGVGTIQVFDRLDEVRYILPYIEQDNLFKR